MGPYGAEMGPYGAMGGHIGPYRAEMGPYGAVGGHIGPGPPPPGPYRSHRSSCPIVKRRRAAPKGTTGEADVGRPIRTGSAQFVRELRGRTFPR